MGQFDVDQTENVFAATASGRRPDESPVRPVALHQEVDFRSPLQRDSGLHS